MNYDRLDKEELLRLALAAMQAGRDEDAISLLKSLLERDPREAHARYLLGALHAQLGMLDAAEDAFRSVLSERPDLAIARFQLGQLLWVRGEFSEAETILEPLNGRPDALGGYARALIAASRGEPKAAMDELKRGLAVPQELPVLEADMRRLLVEWQTEEARHGAGTPPSAAAPMLLANYGRGA